MQDFTNLHAHSHFSILQSLISPKELLEQAKSLGQIATSLTDHGTFAGIWDAWKVSKELGIKLIVGCEFYFLDDLEKIGSDKFKYVVLLAKNQIGYRNLLLLNKAGFDKQFIMMKKVIPVIDWGLLEKHKEGVICLTGCMNGILGAALNRKDFDGAERIISRLRDMFGDDLAIEVQAHNTTRNATTYLDGGDQNFTNFHAIRLGKKMGVRVVATCNAYYGRKEDADTHDVLLAVGAGQPIYSNNRIKFGTSDLYLRGGDDVAKFFARNHGDEVAKMLCDNSAILGERCEVPEWIEPKFTNPAGKEFPVFDITQEDDYAGFIMWMKLQKEKVQKSDDDAAFLRFRCERVFDKMVPRGKEKEYRAWLEEELEVFEFQKFSSYMLIVADYLDWARKNDIICGPGRGSVGGSLIGFLLDIHKADPIKYGLVFARFQNREKQSYPDIDVDIATSGREKLIDYIKGKYGKDSVVAVSNFARITPKVYARDVARSCDLANDRKESVILGNKVAESIPADNKNDLQFEKLYSLPLFHEYAEKYQQYKKHSRILGSYRNVATHAAGLLIGSRAFTGLIPLRRDKDGAILAEYEKERSEENGLLKVDVLGLSTLDLIADTLKLIKQSGKEINQDYLNYDRYDKATYDLIASGDTYGVFQLGISAGTISLCKKIKPKNIDDLAIITTLARPSSRSIREDFISTREGKKQFRLLHPSLKSAFQDTFGFGLYDESILKLGQDVAGWSLNSADRIRKMIKEKNKNPEKNEKLRIEFINDAVKTGIERPMATRIWDEQLRQFSNYTFNRSHAVVYSFLSFTTAYLKAHYPIEFLLANLMAEVKSSAKIAKENIDKIKRELRAHDIQILPPNINTSELAYSVIDNNKLLTGLDALKFVGDDAIHDMLAKRPFSSFADFMLRTDPSKVRANTIQALIASGSLDSFGLSRRLMYLYCSDYRKKLTVWRKKHDPEKETFEFPWPVEPEWSKAELYALERTYIGEAFICGKQEAYGNGRFFQKATTIREVREMTDKEKAASMFAEIKSVFEFSVKKERSKYLGQPMIKATIEDANNDQITLTIFPDTWKRIKGELRGKHKFDMGLAIHFGATVNEYNDETGLVLDDLYDVCPTPAIPLHLKAKKVVVKKAATEENLKEISIDDTDKFVEDVEDHLFAGGMIELDEEEDDFGLF
jgi:DNA polymerase III subunit alpha